MIRALVVDDETPARLGIRALLERTGDFAVVGEAADGATALQAIRSTSPDVVFLDVQMPRLGGLEVAGMLPPNPPLIVFVTAHDRYALQAFDTHAIDYLLKPITPSRFGRAVERVRTAVSGGERLEQHARLVAFLETVLSPGTETAVPRVADGGRRLTIRDGDRYLFVSAAEVDWIESEGNYARLHVGDSAYRMRATLAELERALGPAEFVRIHRATIVNRSRIREVRPQRYGECLVVLRDGRELSAARRYRRQLLVTPP